MPLQTQDIINKAMTFDTKHVFERFQTEISKKYNINDQKQAEEIKDEAIKFLIMCALHKDKEVAMFSEIVDDFWHTFILFTKDYFAFCKELGQPYIHHSPTTNEEKMNKVEGQTFDEFATLYEDTFNTKLPDIWGLRYDNETKTCYNINVSHCKFCNKDCRKANEQNASCSRWCGGNCTSRCTSKCRKY